MSTFPIARNGIVALIALAVAGAGGPISGQGDPRVEMRLAPEAQERPFEARQLGQFLDRYLEVRVDGGGGEELFLQLTALGRDGMVFTPFTPRAPLATGELGLAIWEPRFGEGRMMRIAAVHDAIGGMPSGFFPDVCLDSPFAIELGTKVGETGDCFPIHYLCVAEER